MLASLLFGTRPIGTQEPIYQQLRLGDNHP